MNWLINIGVLLAITGILAIAAGVLYSALRGDSNVSAGGVVFIGPIPIVFGSDRKTAYSAAVLGIILMVVYYLVYRK